MTPNLDAISQVGLDIHNLVKPYAYGLLTVCGGINLAFEFSKLSVPGAEGNRSPWTAFVKWLAFYLLLHFTGEICVDIRAYCTSLALKIGLTDIATYLMDLRTELHRQIPTDGLTVASAWKLLTGSVSFVMLIVTSALSIWTINTFQGIQAIIYALLTAVGPLVVAASILPGAQGVLSGWIKYLVEIASWNIIGAITLKMLLAANLASFESKGMDWIDLLSSNLSFCTLIALVPAISSRLVGSSFGAFSSPVQKFGPRISDAPT